MRKGNQSKSAGPTRFAALANTPGIDIRQGVALVGGDHGFYCAMLRKFVRRFADTAQVLKTVLAAGDRDAAIVRVHAVKGVAGNLGFDALDRSAGRFEDVLRGGQGDLQRCREEFQRLLDVLITAIGRDLPPDEPPSSSGPKMAPEMGADRSIFQTHLTQLERAVALNQPVGAKQALAGLGRYQWPPAWESLISRLADAIHGYRFDDARMIHAQLAALLAETEEP